MQAAHEVPLQAAHEDFLQAALKAAGIQKHELPSRILRKIQTNVLRCRYYIAVYLANTRRYERHENAKLVRHTTQRTRDAKKQRKLDAKELHRAKKRLRLVGFYINKYSTTPNKEELRRLILGNVEYYKTLKFHITPASEQHDLKSIKSGVVIPKNGPTNRDEFLHFIQFNGRTLGTILGSSEWADLHPQYNQILNLLWGQYYVYYSTQDYRKALKLLSQACVVADLLYQSTKFFKIRLVNCSKSLFDIFKCFRSKMIFKYLDEYLNHLGIQYNDGSSQANNRTRDYSSRFSGFLQKHGGFINLCFSKEDPRIVFHSSRRKECSLLIGKNFILTFEELFLKGKKIMVGYIRNKFILKVWCHNDHRIANAAKRAEAMVSAKIEPSSDEFYERDEFTEAFEEEMKKQPNPIECTQVINLTEILCNGKAHIKEGHKTVKFSPEELQQCRNLHKRLLLTHGSGIFPEAKIVFCPDPECNGQFGFLSLKTVNTCCMHCHKNFCTVCNIPQVHAVDGSQCHAEVVARLALLGPDTCICPRYPICSNPIYRVDGCDKVKCICGATMCWECKKLTALQRPNLLRIQALFAELNRSLMCVDDWNPFLYFHVNGDDCKNKTFYKLTDLPNRIDEVVFYENGRNLDEGDFQIVLQMMKEAIEINHNIFL